MFKQFLLAVLAAASLYAEASFDQIQSLIDKQQYKQAVLALNIIADNHPNSSKVQYTLAQAQAGLGNLPAAREALDKAIAINPKLDFVPVKQVEELSKTINTVRVIRKVEQESHWFLWSAGAIATLTAIWYFFFREFKSCTPEPTKRHHPGYGFTTRKKGLETQTIHSRRPDDTSSPVVSTTSGYHPSYSRPNGKPSEVNHYYHDQSRGSDLGTTILASAATAAIVSSLMDDDSHNHRSDSTESYRPSYVTPEVLPSSSWNDSTPSTDTSWEDTSSTSSKSSSWDDESSSSSDSWSSSSDSWSSGGGD